MSQQGGGGPASPSFLHPEGWATLHHAEKVLLGCWVIYTATTVIGFVVLGIILWHFIAKLW